MRTSKFLATVAIAAVCPACPANHLVPLQPCTVSAVGYEVRVNNVDKVDLLFMVDNSDSMGEEQALLAEEFPRMIRVLASGDKDGDGVVDFPPVRDLHVGVISSDMGAGEWRGLGNCSGNPDGDDGALLHAGNLAIPGCATSYPGWLEFSAGGAQSVESFAQDFACVARLGTGGCGFEQQLGSMLKALTPSDAGICPPTEPRCQFTNNTSGQGDRANRGFLREDSLLAVIQVTDEEDCSTNNTELFNPASQQFNGDVRLRCFNNPGALSPTSRFVDGLLALRPNPSLLVFGLIGGIPTNLINAEGNNFAEILASNDMVLRPNTRTGQAEPSCTYRPAGASIDNTAAPPRRIIEVARDLAAAGASSVVTSICQDDFTDSLNAIIDKIALNLGGHCLPRPLSRDARHKAECDVKEILPTRGDVTTCAQLASQGRQKVGVDAETGGEICVILQLGVSADTVEAGLGWYYDDFSADTVRTCSDTPQRIAFAEGARPVTGARVELECLQPAQLLVRESRGATVGTICDGDNTLCDGGSELPSLMCDVDTGTCQLSCTGDIDCPAAWVCDKARAGQAVCVNPTCG